VGGVVVDRAALVSREFALAPDLAGAIALAGIDLTLEPRPLQDAIRPFQQFLHEEC
jgi:hypothetical protein